MLGPRGEVDKAEALLLHRSLCYAEITVCPLSILSLAPLSLHLPLPLCLPLPFPLHLPLPFRPPPSLFCPKPQDTELSIYRPPL